MKTLTRFESYFNKTDGCWVWRGSLNTHGYGQFKLHYKNIGAHRISHLLYVGEIPAGLQIDHLCRNRACVNPKHLRLLTLKENVLSGIGITAQNLKKTKCPKGHLYDKINSQNRRCCSTCQKEASRRSYMKKKSQKVCV